MEAEVGEYADVGGVKVHYTVEGSGSAVILIHGNGLSGGQWRYNIAPLAKYYKVYAPDLPGFGLSDKPDAEYGVEYYVSILKGFMDALGIRKAALVGSSMAGAVAATFASRCPGRVSGLVLSDPTGFGPDNLSRNKELYNAFLSLMIRSRRLYCRPMLYDSSNMKLLEDMQLVTDSKESRDAFVKNCKCILNGDSSYVGTIMAITAPTLIIWGEDDLLLPAEDAKKYKELIAGSKVKLIERSGHMPNVERYAEFNAAVLNFLGGIGHLST